MDTIMGYKRADGRFGIRNYVIAISLVQCSNSTTVKIAQKCDIPYILTDTGCGQYKEDAERSNLGMICAGIHPNVYGVLLVSLGCQWTDASYIASEIEKAGKKVVHLCIQKDGGVKATIEKGIKAVGEMQAEAAAQPRVECPLSGLVISTYPGGSDWTSSLSCNPVLGEAADILVKEKGASKVGGGVRGSPGSESSVLEKAISYELGCRILEIQEEYRHDVIKLTGQKIQDVNPTPGNKAGGITTLCEKAIGSSRLGGTAPIQGILKVGEKPPYPGSWFIDNRTGGNDVYATTTVGMSGAHIILFSTGRGTPLGSAVSAVIKVTGNPDTYAKLGEEMIDYCGAPILKGEKTVKEAGKELYDLMIEVANGKKTKAELIGDYSYVTPPARNI